MQFKMKTLGKFIFSFRQIILLAFYVVSISCEKSATISPPTSTYNPRLYTSTLISADKVPEEIKSLLKNENIILKKHIKFPMAYYLIQEHHAKFLYSPHFNEKIKDQLFMTVSGSKYYKLFIHPDFETSFAFLSRAYRYIGPGESEFFATPTSTPLTVAIWNKNNLSKMPFLVKIGIDNDRRAILSGGRLPAEVISDAPETMQMIFHKEVKSSKIVIEGQQITQIPSL